MDLPTCWAQPGQVPEGHTAHILYKFSSSSGSGDQEFS